MTDFFFHFSSNVYFRITNPRSIKAASSLLDRAAGQGWRDLGGTTGVEQWAADGQAEVCSSSRVGQISGKWGRQAGEVVWGSTSALHRTGWGPLVG